MWIPNDFTHVYLNCIQFRHTKIREHSTIQYLCIGTYSIYILPCSLYEKRIKSKNKTVPLACVHVCMYPIDQLVSKNLAKGKHINRQRPNFIGKGIAHAKFISLACQPLVEFVNFYGLFISPKL